MGKLSQIQEMKLRVLTQTYGKTEKEALDWLAKDTLDKHEAAASNAPQKPAPKAQPKPTERRELRDKSGKADDAAADRSPGGAVRRPLQLRQV